MIIPKCNKRARQCGNATGMGVPLVIGKELEIACVINAITQVTLPKTVRIRM